MTLDIDSLLEGWDFEAKLAIGQDGRGQLPKNLWETYIAMANTHGGAADQIGSLTKDNSFLDKLPVAI